MAHGAIARRGLCMQSVAMRCTGSFALPFVLALAAALGGAGCGGDDDDDDGDVGGQPDASSDGADVDAAVDAGIDAGAIPLFRNPVDMPDEALGTAVLQQFGAPVDGAQTNCNTCHGMTQENLRFWSVLSERALSQCLTDLAPTDAETARTMIDCLRADPTDAGSVFRPEKLGIYATGAHLPWFRYLFDLAYGGDGAAMHQEFVDQIDMPRNDLGSIDQREFDIIAEYYARHLPQLAQLLPNPPDPEGCVLDVSEGVADHVLEMETSGWRAVNADNGLLMFGCGGAETARDCLTAEPRVEEWEALPGIVVRSLSTVDYQSSYWTRSSADGRFVAHGVQAGLGASAAFVDLQSDKIITADALYDPGFFPDNSGFAFQPPAHFCPQAVLTAGPDTVDFTEPGCTTVGQVGLYQHVGAALGGGDYWTVDSQFVSDNGGHSATLGDPSAGFDSGERSSLTPMIFNGRTYDPGPSISVDTPNEGDTVISPSARLLITRVRGASSQQSGFNLRRVDATPTPGGYEIEVPRIARYCVNGGKPGFSYDERWISYHHYVDESDAVDLGFDGPDDPGFAAYLSQGASNIYVMDLLTGQTTRVTSMAPGEYALYPHFRSDGWIYFLVRQTPSGSGETIAATDAALVLEN